MRQRHSAGLLAAAGIAVLGLLWSGGLILRAQEQASAPEDARIWIGRAAEVEDYLRTAQIVKLEDLSVGVTKPKKATLAPGGPVGYLAWKVIPPGRYGGAWESYLSEIAAYELDKILGLNMVPPAVEKTYKGDKGAAIMWASPTKNFKDFNAKGGAPTPPPRYQAAWSLQLVRAKMFDNLIGNTDPNLGNWLADPAWHILLIDHSRAFTSSKDMTHQLVHIDADLWQKMLALNEEQLRPVIGKMMDGGQFKAIFARRDKMRQVIADLVKAKGEAEVFVREGGLEN